jgi:hypothetical protein
MVLAHLIEKQDTGDRKNLIADYADFRFENEDWRSFDLAQDGVFWLCLRTSL